MLVTNDNYLARRCQLIRNHGENAVDYTDESLVNAFEETTVYGTPGGHRDRTAQAH